MSVRHDEDLEEGTEAALTELQAGKESRSANIGYQKLWGHA
jgi:hypothetical protein